MQGLIYNINSSITDSKTYVILHLSGQGILVCVCGGGSQDMIVCVYVCVCTTFVALGVNVWHQGVCMCVSIEAHLHNYTTPVLSKPQLYTVDLPRVAISYVNKLTTRT